jgi:DNA-binding MurR/RpiR family transcriptional regulator
MFRHLGACDAYHPFFMGVVDRIQLHASRLTAAERKVASVLAHEPQAIAFGTVAQVALRAGTSGPSVVRLAVKLGYGGFVDLQAAVQAELAEQLGPARARIRQEPTGDLLDQTLVVEQDNVASTLRGIEPPVFDEAVALLADPGRCVWVMPGAMTKPVGLSLASDLADLRDGVRLLEGSEVGVSRGLAGLKSGDVVVAIDIQRYERWLIDTLQYISGLGAVIIALTDSPLSPLANPNAETHLTFFVAAHGAGPFDSLVGMLALGNALVAGAASRLRSSAAERLDAIENAWNATDSLLAEASEGRSVQERVEGRSASA